MGWAGPYLFITATLALAVETGKLAYDDQRFRLLRGLPAAKE